MRVVAPVAAALAALLCGYLMAREQPSVQVHAVALFAHLVFVVVGFGAVLTVDWVALLWSVRQRSFRDVLTAADNVAVPIWVGYAGLVFSGVVLEPDLSNPLTQLKIVLVVVAGWNGLFSTWLQVRLHGGLSRRLLIAAGSSALVSQVCWWGALIIGHINTQS